MIVGDDDVVSRIVDGIGQELSTVCGQELSVKLYQLLSVMLSCCCRDVWSVCLDVGGVCRVVLSYVVKFAIAQKELFQNNNTAQTTSQTTPAAIPPKPTVKAPAQEHNTPTPNKASIINVNKYLTTRA
jgi:hypothetical protein